VLIVGTRSAYCMAVSRALSDEGLYVVATPSRSTPTASEGDAPFYAIVLIAPVLVYDFGDVRPRRFAVGVDPFGDVDPRNKGRWVGANRRLGTRESRHFVETVATPGTRVAMVNASLMLNPNPRGELDGVFASSDVPLLLHEQVTLLQAPLSRAIPQIWSVDALPSGRRDGWGLGGFSALHAPPPPFGRSDQLLESARDLVKRLERLRYIEGW